MYVHVVYTRTKTNDKVRKLANHHGKSKLSKVCISLACTMCSLRFQKTAQSSHSLAACEGQGYSGSAVLPKAELGEAGRS